MLERFLQSAPSWLHYQGLGWGLIFTPYSLICKFHSGFVSGREDDEGRVK